jgi:predicted Zn finger-like uncharacterized protein
MSSDKFQIICPTCQTSVTVSTAHLGKKGRCPTCKTVFPIEAQPVLAEMAPEEDYQLAPLPGAQPSYPQASFGQPALGQPGLTPLAPLGAAPFGQPTPFGQSAAFGQPTPGLTPLAGNAWGGAPNIPNPLANVPNPYGAAAPIQPAGSPFGAAPVNQNPYAPPTTSTWQDTMQRAAGADDWRKAKNRSDFNSSMWGGLGMMVFAVVWFVGGLMFDILFFYPPVLFIIGLVAFVRGIVNLVSE